MIRIDVRHPRLPGISRPNRDSTPRWTRRRCVIARPKKGEKSHYAPGARFPHEFSQRQLMGRLPFFRSPRPQVLEMVPDHPRQVGEDLVEAPVQAALLRPLGDAEEVLDG